LEEIDEQNWEYAHRLFQCVAAASRPLRAEELAEFLAFDFKAESTPTFLDAWRYGGPRKRGVIDLLQFARRCQAAFRFPGCPICAFFSQGVLDVRTACRNKGHHFPFPRFDDTTHTIVAQTCLGVLLHLDENITEDSLKDFPLAEYAAVHWVGHARFENVWPKVHDGVMRLFDPSKGHLSVWVWIYDPEEPRRRFE
jgi:hypothetical protein